VRPTEYEDVKDIVTETIFSYELDSIVEVLSFSYSIGPILPIEHIVELQIQEAITAINDSYDDRLLDEIHNTLKIYVGQKIRIFSSAAKKFLNNDNYKLNIVFDESFLWCERFYFDMFGIWSPRMIVIDSLKEHDGRELNFYEHNFERHCYCPMRKSEIKKELCDTCPFLTKKSSSVKCKYKLGL